MTKMLKYVILASEDLSEWCLMLFSDWQNQKLHPAFNTLRLKKKFLAASYDSAKVVYEKLMSDSRLS